jgi:hypothetical protein
LPSFDGITDSTAAHNSSEITPIRVTGQFSLVRTRIFGRHALVAGTPIDRIAAEHLQRPTFPADIAPEP